MKKNTLHSLALAGCAGVLCITLAGCQGNAANTSNEQSAPSKYMSTVSTMVDTLSGELDSFSEAVSRQDVVSMRKQLDVVSGTVAEIAKVEVPSEISEVGAAYNEGCAALEKALSQYVDLYDEVLNGSGSVSDYAGRIAEIQKTYDEGIAALKTADEKAAATNTQSENKA